MSSLFNKFITIKRGCTALVFFLLLPFKVTFADSATIAAPVTINPLTPHQAEYQVFFGDISLGKARYKLPAPEGDYYRYQFDSDVSFLLLSDLRNVISEFTLTEDNKLKPLRYSHKRQGVGSDYQEQTVFIQDREVIHSRYKDEKYSFPYEEALFDPLMVQLQFRLELVNNDDSERDLHYSMVKSGEVDHYSFKIVGKELLSIESGQYETVKIEVIRNSSKRQTFFWMAPKLGYLPVRLTHFKKGSKQLDISLLNYQFHGINFEPTQQKSSL